MFDLEELATGMRVGDSRKVQHCGTDRSASLSVRQGYITLKCFRCGEVESTSTREQTLSARAARAAIHVPKRGPVPLPADADADVTAWPADIVVWLLKAGITPDVASAVYGMRYSMVLGRLCIPTPTGFTARSTRRVPKYLQFGANCRYTAGDNSATVVVVEDILSAISVAAAGYTGCALLGTSVGGDDAAYLASFTTVVGWFDADAAGRAAWAELRARLGLYPVTPVRVTTDVDPKHVHRARIVDLIEHTRKR